MKYMQVTKARGLWWVLDEDGYEVSYVGYDTKREALESARVFQADEREATRLRADSSKREG
jgi:hypothetical protein